MQELSIQNDSLKQNNQSLNAKVDTQQKQIDDLKTMMLELQNSFNSCNPCSSNNISQSSKTILISGASLEQNIPNPFNHTTTINYTLPQTYSSAKIIIVDKSGKVLKEVNISTAGKGSVKLDALTLASGAYNYSLYVDGRLIDTKQMALQK